MKPHGLAVGALDPETSHKEDDDVGGEWRGEGIEGTTCSLLRIVDIFREIFQPCGSHGYVNLHKSIGTIGPDE